MAGKIGTMCMVFMLMTGFFMLASLTVDNVQAAQWDIIVIDMVGTGTYDKQISIALDSMGYPHIAYEEWNNFDLKHAWWNGSAWGTEIVDGPGQVGFWPSIAIDTSDHIHISYNDMMNRDLVYAKWDGVAWNISIPDSAGTTGEYSSIDVDKNGYPNISYKGSGC